MTTSVFATIGTNIGSAVISRAGMGASGSPFPGSNILTSFVKSKIRSGAVALGTKLAGEIFGEDEINTIKGSRLNDLTVQTSTYGDIIPIIFGRAKIAGNIIWARPVKEIPVTTSVSGGGKGGVLSPSRKTETRFSYKATFAIALCEGEIANIERVWADSDLVNLGDYCMSFTLYKGSETQLPDPIIESFEGIGSTPAYRGMAYVVFEDFDLNSFGNRIPNLSFEVNRPIKGSFNGVTAVEDLVTGINIIPGAGEFVYDTVIQTKIYGVEVNDVFIQRGGSDVVNMNNSGKKADVLLSIDQLESTFPNLEWVSIVCSWFADSLDANATTIEPKVEYKLNTITQPDLWSVGGYNRDNAQQITLDVNDSSIYGGTPSDESIIRLIDELKARGLKVMFYPMIFVDDSDKPWRGRMTTSADNIPNFFTKVKGYNEFVLHYANLTKDKADAFVIGSEMKGLTQVQNGTSFPAVSEFVDLAAEVKMIMGSYTKITYAGDWSEYHSINGWYNMDPLWASPDVDFIGIDAYFPLTDRPQDGIYDLQEVIDGWENGEGYDWYYGDAERTTKINLAEQHAWKNIEYWWSNTHTNPNSVMTSWVPGSKKIWFTEFGFPSVDGATNQPNVFYNPDSSEGALPYHSEGYNDFTAQRLGIEATLLKWQDSEMVEQKLLWSWDARPYPFWPDISSVWGDGALWSKGHWVNGKLGGGSLAGIVSEICERSGLSDDDIDVGDLQKIVDGYVLNARVSGTKAIEKLSEAMFFNGVETDGVLKFGLKGKADETEILQGELSLNENKEVVTTEYLPETYLPTKLDLNFLNRENNYNIGSTSDFRDSISARQGYEINLPIVLTATKAKTVAEISLAENWISRKKFKFSLPYNHIQFDIGDVINLELENGQIEDICIEKINFRKNVIDITGRSTENSIYGLLDHDDFIPSNGTETIDPNIETKVEILDISTLPGDDMNKAYLRFAVSGGNVSWNGAEIFYSTTTSNYQSLGIIHIPSVMGNVVNEISDSSTYIIDEEDEIEVLLLNGELESTTDENLLNGANLALIGNEIIQFRTAEFLEEGRYRLKGLLRGRLGTENATSVHEEGERFVLLDNLVLRTELFKNLIGSTLNIKVVSFGQNINNVNAISITYKAQNLVPYAVAEFEAVKDISGDIGFSWVRRSREFSTLRDNVDMPLSESFEAYRVDIIDDMDQVVRSIDINSPEAVYSDSDQVTDFGLSLTEVRALVYQISENVGKGVETEKTFNF